MFQGKSFHGGGEKLFYNLIKRFSEDGFSVDIYCSKSDIRQVEYINKISVVEEIYDHNIPGTMENFYNKVKTLIKNENYDFVISENITPPVDITFLQGHSLINRLKRTKNFFEAFLYNFRKVKKQRIKYQRKWIKQGYRRIFTVSEMLKRDIMENFGVPAEKISVVYPGVDIPETKNSASSEKTITFGLLAPGFKIKGGFVFLKALKILKKGGCNFKAKIIYPKFSKNIGVQLLVKLYNLSDNVEFLPYQEDIVSFYSSINCLVAPSLEDTFNLAVLEAMACGKPCIISQNAGACEIIRDKINGFTFDIRENGAENLAEKMMIFINNPEKHVMLANSAFETAKNYSWNRTYEQFSEELKK